jgi:hypothetical protein
MFRPVNVEHGGDHLHAGLIGAREGAGSVPAFDGACVRREVEVVVVSALEYIAQREDACAFGVLRVVVFRPPFHEGVEE